MSSMIPMDYHIHTKYSCDCDETMEAMSRAAVAAGIRQIGFSDHFDPIPLDDCHGYFKPNAWWQALDSCRALFADTLSIQAGIEVGEPHRFPEETNLLLSNHPWDFVLGSLHWVGDHVVFGSQYFMRTPQEAYRNYFDEMHQMVTTGDFDILAHMDVVKRYGYDNYGDFDPALYEDEIRNVLNVAAARGLAIEINTSTLRRSIAKTSPDRMILRWFFEEGGEFVTLGSDAHHTGHVGFGLHRALEILVEAGFTQLTAYDRRKAYMIDIESGSFP